MSFGWSLTYCWSDLRAGASAGSLLPSGERVGVRGTGWQGKQAKHGRPPAIVVMGVSGSGKTTIANALARQLGWEFEDGDWFHPAANVEKMHNGAALDRRGSAAVARRHRPLDRRYPRGRPARHRCLLGLEAALPRDPDRRPAGRAPGLSQGRRSADRPPHRHAARAFHAGEPAREPVRGARGARPRRVSRSSVSIEPSPREIVAKIIEALAITTAS